MAREYDSEAERLAVITHIEKMRAALENEWPKGQDHRLILRAQIAQCLLIEGQIRNGLHLQTDASVATALQVLQEECAV